ncbi:MAG: hypothetical protein KJ964_13410, partial [Verrucomicrobia bacterium]|nr:hypothetical protein [Verrucomicrobiota bacterium]
MISSLIIYLELFVVLFFLPGFFITVILGIKKFRFLLSFAFSYALLVLTLLPFEYYAQPIARWQWCVLLEWVILAVLAVVKTLVFSQKDFSDSIRGFLNSRLCLPRLLVPLFLAGVICGYLAYAGIYLEIPTDAWTHASWFQWHKSDMINLVCFPPGLSFQNLLLYQTFSPWYFNPWYFMHAWLGHVSGLAIMEFLHVLTFVNVTVFLLGFYYFGLFLFSGLRISALKKMMMAAIASLFAAATMGNNVFAYIRYYAFAPTILNYVLFLAAMAVIIDWLRSNRWFGYAHHRWFDSARFDFAQCRHHRWLGHALWIAPVLLIVTNAIHAQEALFIFFMTLALSLWETTKMLWRKFTDFCNRRTPLLRLDDYAGRVLRDNRWTVREWKNLIMAGILLLVFFAWFAAIRHFKPGSWISPDMIMPHAGLPTEPVNFIFRNLIISVPENPYL